MCFSPWASFTAGGALVVLGVATFRLVRCPSEVAFAAIPLLFGIQQVVSVWCYFAAVLSVVVCAHFRIGARTLTTAAPRRVDG